MRTAKGQLIGSPAALVRPAWRHQHVSGTGDDAGSRILISKLPADVAEPEIEELFKKTVGPLKESFIVYNSQGRSKGIAVVSFLRAGDATVARQKYHGKIVDGRRPIKIEIVVDGFPTLQSAPPPPGPSLLNRLGVPPTGKALQKSITNGTALPSRQPRSFSIPPPRNNDAPHASAPPTYVLLPSISARIAPAGRVRQKKGPRRAKKSLAQLDREMEEYRAAADVFNFGEKSVSS